MELIQLYRGNLNHLIEGEHRAIQSILQERRYVMMATHKKDAVPVERYVKDGRSIEIRFDSQHKCYTWSGTIAGIYTERGTIRELVELFEGKEHLDMKLEKYAYKYIKEKVILLQAKFPSLYDYFRNRTIEKEIALNN